MAHLKMAHFCHLRLWHPVSIAHLGSNTAAGLSYNHVAETCPVLWPTQGCQVGFSSVFAVTSAWHLRDPARSLSKKTTHKSCITGNEGGGEILREFPSFHSHCNIYWSKRGTRKGNFLSLSFWECQTVLLSLVFGNHCLCIEKSNSGTTGNCGWEGLPDLKGLRWFLFYCTFKNPLFFIVSICWVFFCFTLLIWS